MRKIQRVSYFFRIIFQIVFVAVPVILLIGWASSPESLVFMGGAIDMRVIPRTYLATSSHGSSILHALSTSEKLLGFGISIVPMMVQLYIIFSLIKLFQLYEKGVIFSIQNVRYIQQIGYALLVGQLINPFYEGVMGVVLTWHNPPGHRFAAFSIDQTNIGIIFMAILVILISWIMAEGCRLREEHELTI